MIYIYEKRYVGKEPRQTKRVFMLTGVARKKSNGENCVDGLCSKLKDNYEIYAHGKHETLDAAVNATKALNDNAEYISVIDFAEPDNDELIDETTFTTQQHTGTTAEELKTELLKIHLNAEFEEYLSSVERGELIDFCFHEDGLSFFVEEQFDCAEKAASFLNVFGYRLAAKFEKRQEAILSARN